MDTELSLPQKMRLLTFIKETPRPLGIFHGKQALCLLQMLNDGWITLTAGRCLKITARGNVALKASSYKKPGIKCAAP